MALRCWDLGRAAPVPHTHPAGPGLPPPSLPTGLLLGQEGAWSRPPVPGWLLFTQVLAAVSAPQQQQQQQHITPRHHTGDHKGLHQPAAGLPPAPPGRVAAPSSHSCPFPVVFACCPQPATAPALPSQPVEAVTATRLCSILAKPSICRQRRAARPALSQHGSRAELGRRGRGQHPGASQEQDSPLSPTTLRCCCLCAEDGLAASCSLLPSAPGEFLLIPQQAPAKEESVLSV